MYSSTYKLDDISEEQFDRAVGILWTNSFECCKGTIQKMTSFKIDLKSTSYLSLKNGCFTYTCVYIITKVIISHTLLAWRHLWMPPKGGGQALFPTFSLLSHSCLANACHVVFPNNHLVLHAKVPIKCGEEITISYISALQVRQKNLEIFGARFFFTETTFRL